MSKFDTKISVTASELAGLIYDMYLTGDPMMIHGSPGIGKSAQVLQAADNLAAHYGLAGVVQWGDSYDPSVSFGYHDIRLINFGPEEFGLPSLDKERGIQVRNPVDWFPSTDRTDLPERGLLVFEEAVSAAPAMQATMYQITHDRRLGDKRLKPGWVVVLTGNLMTDGGVVHKMPTPLANRVTHVYVRSDVDSWTDWAIDHGIDNSLIAFIRFRNDLLNTFNDHVEKRSKDHAFATERTWEKIDKKIKINPNVHRALLAGDVGNGPATEYAAFRQIWQSMPNIDNILMDPTGSPVPEEAAVRYAVTTALAGRATRDNFDVICQYIERLPAEFTVLTVKDSIRRHGNEITSTGAFIKMASKYADYLK